MVPRAYRWRGYGMEYLPQDCEEAFWRFHYEAYAVRAAAVFVGPGFDWPKTMTRD